jgi:hypothetical protein
VLNQNIHVCHYHGSPHRDTNFVLHIGINCTGRTKGHVSIIKCLNTLPCHSKSLHSDIRSDNKVRELATACLPWRQWTETSVWFHDVGIPSLLFGSTEKAAWKNLMEMTRTFCNNSWILHHNNVPAHTALPVRKFLASKQITVLEHPPCSPDLAPN